jgi:two-component system OmpR family sensor kinase
VRSAPGHTEFTVGLPPAARTEAEPPSPAGAMGLSERR